MSARAPSAARRSARGSAAFVTGRRGAARRCGALALLLVLPLVAVFARLVQRQWAEHARWLARAEGNTRRLEAIRPPRGPLRFADGTVAAGVRPVLAVEVRAGATLPPDALHAAVARHLGCDAAEAATRIRRRDPAARQAAHAARVAAWRDTCAALAAATAGRSIGVGADDVLFRAAELEAETLRRMGLEWARIVGIALREAAVPRPFTLARAVAATGDAEHADWVAEQRGPALLPEPSGPALAALAARRRAALREALAAHGTADLTGRGDFAARLRDADRIFDRYLARALANQPLLLLPEIDDAAVLAIEVRPGGPLPGVGVVARGVRTYPQGELGGHVLGTLGLPTVREQPDGREVDEYRALADAGAFWDRVGEVLDRADYEELERDGAFRGEPMGRSGLERACDLRLTGRYGVRITENDARGRLREVLLAVPPFPGSDCTCTLWPHAQRVAESALRDACAEVRAQAIRDGLEFADQPNIRGAAAVVLDVQTGAVRVCASWPGFDPNQLVPPVPHAVAEALFQGPASRASPNTNRAIQGRYPPGSVLKVVAAAAAMEAGVGPGERFTCTGKWSAPNDPQVFSCMHACGAVTIEEALERSCNVTFYQLGHALGARLRAAAAALGLGHTTGCGLPYESAGALADDANVVQLAIGQGQVDVTPMQVARLYAAIANGGRLVVPRLLEAPDRPAAPAIPLLAPGTAARLHEGLRLVVEGRHGTAREVSLLRRVRAAGKTGTAEKPADALARAIMSTGPWNVVWFAGYAPHDAPRFAIAVMIEWVPHKSYAGDVAAPVAAKILQAVLAPPEPSR